MSPREKPKVTMFDRIFDQQRVPSAADHGNVEIFALVIDHIAKNLVSHSASYASSMRCTYAS